MTVATVDLHVHSTASDGRLAPGAVIRHAAAAGLAAVALTDHDTIDGLPEACEAAAGLGIRVVTGCEFSVAAQWGELHLLAYFLPVDSPAINAFLHEQRTARAARGARIVERLHEQGVDVTIEDVLEEANGGALGRPHVARALVSRGIVPDVPAAFERYLGRHKPAFVAKNLPQVAQVTALVRDAGGVTSAAHLGERATRGTLARLQRAGVDGVEVLHPSHDPPTAERIRMRAHELGLAVTGGSDWHGGAERDETRAPLGGMNVPAEWLVKIEQLANNRDRRQVTRET